MIIDRTAASRLGVQVQDIDNALNNAFSQRQISTVFTQRNQYRVILEIDPLFQRDPSDLDRVYIAGGTAQGSPAPRRCRYRRWPSSRNPTRRCRSITRANIRPPPSPGTSRADTPLETAAKAVMQAVAEMHLPDTVRTDFAGDMKVFRESAASQEMLILAALIAVYIVLGVLYESLAHPLTIISTLPAAGLGALLALAVVRRRTQHDRLHWDHPADRHRQEERHHAGGFRD